MLSVTMVKIGNRVGDTTASSKLLNRKIIIAMKNVHTVHTMLQGHVPSEGEVKRLRYMEILQRPTVCSLWLLDTLTDISKRMYSLPQCLQTI